MEFFTINEFLNRYSNCENIDEAVIIEASEMIFAQVSPAFRDNTWNGQTVPQSIKNATMEQARFLIAHDIPHLDTHDLKAGEMSAKLITEYSTLSLTILANAGYLYRGNPINYNMSMDIEFGG